MNINIIKDIIKNDQYISSEMINTALVLIENLYSVYNCKCNLDLQELYNLSPNVDENIFYETVFYLTRPRIKFLIQNFKVFNPISNKYIEFEDKNLIIEMMREENYVNPITNSNLSLEEFGNQVLTYFTVAEEYKD